MPDEPPLWQSPRGALYQDALDRLVAARLAYPCACSRKDIDAALAAQRRSRTRATANGSIPAPAATACTASRRAPGASPSRVRGRPGRRLLDGTTAAWAPQQQDVGREVGDFVLQRADGPWAYQLAVVVDDADQGITDVVRGEDLADNTARQILLQRALGLPTPSYLHTPLVLGADGEKLSKQNGAQPLATARRPRRWPRCNGRGAGAGPARRRHGARWPKRSPPGWPQWRDLYNPPP